MNDIVSVQAPKKRQKKYGRTPKAQPNDYWVRWLPQTGRVRLRPGTRSLLSKSLTVLIGCCTAQLVSAGHFTLWKNWEFGVSSFLLGQGYGDDSLDPVIYLRERIVAESDRAKSFIDYVLAQNGVIIDERWKWILAE